MSVLSNQVETCVLNEFSNASQFCILAFQQVWNSFHVTPDSRRGPAMGNEYSMGELTLTGGEVDTWCIKLIYFVD